MNLLSKVYVDENGSLYPGVVVNQVGEAYIVLKYDTTLWRRVVCLKENLIERTDDFSEFIFAVRQKFLNIPANFSLPSG
jgi:hypothetical protein